MMLRHVDQNVYEKEVSKSDQPVLLCFVKNTVFQNEIIISIVELSRQFESIQFCAVKEEEHPFFLEKFHFWGTPIFIFLVKGMEKGRLLGSVTTDRLRAFIERHIGELKEP